MAKSGSLNFSTGDPLRTLSGSVIFRSQTLRIFQSIAGDYDDCCLPSSTCAVMFHPDIQACQPGVHQQPWLEVAKSPVRSQAKRKMIWKMLEKPSQDSCVWCLGLKAWRCLKCLKDSERCGPSFSSMRRLPVLTPSWLICAHRFINVITTT